MFAQVWVNEVDTGLVVAFARRGNDLSATGDDLRAVGLGIAAGSAPVPLRTIAGLSYRIDEATQTVRMSVATAGMRNADIAPSKVRADDVQPVWGGLLNYSIYGDDTGTGGVTGELRLFGPAGTLSSGMLVRRQSGRQGLTVQRLETRYVFEDPGAARRLTVGDFIGSDGSAEGAIRGGGIQLTTDFTLQPDLVTAPMPRLSGGNGVPSTIDLYVDGVHRLTENVQAGRFAMSSLPMVDGAGRISLLVRDVLGHESVQQLSFYGSRQLLRTGLTASSVQVGLLRTQAFAAGDHYGAAFASSTIRRGLSDRLTGEARLAVAGEVQVAGAGMTGKIGEVAIVSLTGDLSRSANAEGGQASLAIRRDDRHVSVFAIAQKTFGRFETLANPGLSMRGWKLQAGASWQARAFGSLSLSATLLASDYSRSRILAASWARPVGRRLSAFVNVVQTRVGRSELLISAGLTMSLSPRSSASLQTSSDRRGASGALSWSRSGDVDGGVDMRAGISSAGGQSRLLGGATMRGSSGQIGADVQLNQHGVATRAFASGAAVWLGGRPILTANVGQSFAVVQTGQPGVDVTLENRPAGRTGRDGSLLLPNLPANAPARIALDYDGVDLDHEAARVDMVARTHGSGGAIVAMPIRLVKAATIHIVKPDGTPMPMGAVVRRPEGREDVVGYDGIAYLTDIEDVVSADIRDGASHCQIKFVRGRDEPVICRPL